MADEQTNKNFFSEFISTGKKDWKNKIISDLKGKAFEKLIWESPEGIEVSHFYTSEDLDRLSYLNTLPGEAPFNRGVKTSNNSWLIHQRFKADNMEATNKEIRAAIQSGISEVEVETKRVISEKDLEILLNKIHPEKVRICLNAGNQPDELYTFLKNYFSNGNYDLNNIKASIEYDPLSKFLSDTNSGFGDTLEEIQSISFLIHELNNHLPGVSILSVHGDILNNAGATIPQELGISLSIGSEYMSFLVESGITAKTASKHMQLIMGIGSNYFMEIAKIRAARLLWSTMVNAYSPGASGDEKIFIRSIPSRWNKTKLDPWVNMLRYTTEALSAALGGADSIGQFPFNGLTKEPGNFSERISRNTQTILKKEAYLEKIADPAAGSYYIENMTDSIAEEAWSFFKEIENRGGYIKACESGYLQGKLMKTQNKRKKNIAGRKEILVGTNHYPDYTEQYPAEELPQSIDGKNWLNQRAATEFEELRKILESQRESKPLAVLFPFGDPAVRTARKIFASNFFGCGGFTIKDLTGISSPDEGMRQCKQINPDVIVFCSSDKEYIKYIPSFAGQFKNTILVVAGNPEEDIPALKESGVNYFIHLRSNVLETLTSILNELRIVL